MANRSIVLTGKRVSLALMTEADQPYFCHWLADNPELRLLIHDPRIPTMQDQKKWFARSQESDRRFFSLVTEKDQTLIGNAGFVDINSTSSSAILRITISHPEYLGKGLGTEAIQLLARYAFLQMGLSSLSLQVLESNTRAIRAYEKVGFTLDSTTLREGHKMFTMKLSSSTFLL